MQNLIALLKLKNQSRMIYQWSIRLRNTSSNSHTNSIICRYDILCRLEANVRMGGVGGDHTNPLIIYFFYFRFPFWYGI